MNSVQQATETSRIFAEIKAAEEMIKMWFTKKDDLVEELIELNDSVFEAKIGDSDGLVKELVAKYLPDEKVESSEWSSATASNDAESSSFMI